MENKVQELEKTIELLKKRNYSLTQGNGQFIERQRKS